MARHSVTVPALRNEREKKKKSLLNYSSPAFILASALVPPVSVWLYISLLRKITCFVCVFNTINFCLFFLLPPPPFLHTDTDSTRDAFMFSISRYGSTLLLRLLLPLLLLLLRLLLLLTTTTTTTTTTTAAAAADYY